MLTDGEFRMSDRIVFHDFTPLKQIEREPYCIVFFSNNKKVTMGGTSDIILMEFRDLSKIIPKMNWGNVVNTLIGK